MSEKKLAGVDVSATTFVAWVEDGGGRQVELQLPNTAAGHRTLIRTLTRDGSPARVCFEPTGCYSEQLALALCVAGIEVMLPNPRAMRAHANAFLQRSKDDRVDAHGALEFLKRMPFRPWSPPSSTARQLRDMVRRIADQVTLQTAERNRLHALEVAKASVYVRRDVRQSIRACTKSIARLRKAALEIVREDQQLSRAFDLIDSIPGFGSASALAVLGELAVLPADMEARHWVSYAGLAPRRYESGTSVRKKARLPSIGNAQLRRALFMPAMVAIQRCAQVRAFHQRLLSRAKTWRQAQVAVMRKLLHAIHAMLRTSQPFQPERFSPSPELNALLPLRPLPLDTTARSRSPRAASAGAKREPLAPASTVVSSRWRRELRQEEA